MRIEVDCPPTLRFGATGVRAASGHGFVGCEIGCRAMGTIGEGRGLGARAGGGFIVAKGMATSVSGYLLLEVVGELERAVSVDGGETDIAEVVGARFAIAASSSRFFAR